MSIWLDSGVYLAFHETKGMVTKCSDTETFNLELYIPIFGQKLSQCSQEEVQSFPASVEPAIHGLLMFIGISNHDLMGLLSGTDLILIRKEKI